MLFIRFGEIGTNLQNLFEKKKSKKRTKKKRKKQVEINPE
jgi:hypothetical protein